jgi:hypothetical protein
MPKITIPPDAPRAAVGVIQREPRESFVPTQIRKTQTNDAGKSSLSFARVLGDAGLTTSSKQTVKMKVSKSSKKVCKVSGKSIKTLSKGMCIVQVSVMPKAKHKKTIAPVTKSWVINVS